MAITDYQETFQIGRVINRSFGVISRNAVTFLAVSALLMVPMMLSSAYFGQQMLAAQSNDPAAMARNLGPFFSFLIGSLLVQTALYYLLQACLVQATITDLNGEKPQMGATLSAGLRVLLPIIVLTILAVLGVMAGFMLLIVPGIILALWWCVVVPVRVVENTGISETFGRSRALTKGYRWRILWLLLMIFVVAILLGFAVRLSMGLSLLENDPTTAFAIPSLIANGVVNILFGGAVSVIVASIYYELRLVKEGIGPQQLASVFD
jgi:hypothetical protein